MKILAVISSARHDGYGAKLTRTLCEQAAAKGAEVEYVYLYDLNFKSCGNCKVLPDDPLWCDKQDDLVPVLKKLVDADALVWSAPIHMDYISGTAKTFYDRFCIFVNEDHSTNRLPGKKLVLILTSGAPAKNYQYVLENMKDGLVNFFKMDWIGSIMAGEFMKAGQQLTDEQISQAKELADKLV